MTSLHAPNGVTPSKYKKSALPSSARRFACENAGGKPGEWTPVSCPQCAAPGYIDWTHQPSWPVYSFEVDHIIPERHGGTHRKENVRLLCRACNRRKGASL